MKGVILAGGTGSRLDPLMSKKIIVLRYENKFQSLKFKV